ncbi:uncharacterized protein LOC110023331 isoform X2 [Phalaenopsis equestris]|uniref:uncharacterized protein LOC110023331 isoform X2 n=1 Tax=Phalaenopsis equestris TaxID=78828 RepID=UPI0009E26393|nr:uncharacterized protein LOC110023331 isoform X2 [Phalaenopsis equestris]
MDHRGGMIRNLAGKADGKVGKSHLHYPRIPASSCPDSCKYGKKNDLLLVKMNGAVSRHSNTPETLDKNFSLKKVVTAQARRKGAEFMLDTAVQIDDNVSRCSGIINMVHSQHSDASSDMIECMSEESVNMKPKTPPRFLKNIRTYEQNSPFFKDGSLEELTLVVPEEVAFTVNENAISIDDVSWAWSNGVSVGSAAMELESPPSALESMASTLTSHDHKLEGSSMEFQVTPQKMISLAADELTDQVKKPSNRFRTMKQEIIRKSMTHAMASSSKDTAGMKPKQHKKMNSLKVDEKQKIELPMLRSSLPVKTSLLGRIEAKKKVDAVVEPSITDEKSSTLIRTVKSIKPIQVGVMPDIGPSTSFSPLIIKKKTLSTPKRIQLSPKQSLLLKTKSSVIKYRSPMSDSGRTGCRSSQDSSENAYNAGLSKVRDEKILKQVAESLVPKSSLNFAPVLNNRKAISVKKQVEAGNVDGVVEQTLISVAHKSTEQKHMKLRALQSSRTLSSGSSTSSSAFISSNCEKESDGSRSTDANVSKKAHIGERKRRTQLHVVEQKPFGAVPKFAEHNRTKLRNLSSRSSISSSAFLSGHEEGNCASRLTVTNTSGSKKTHIGERKGTTPLPVVEQKLFGVALMTVEQKSTKLEPQLSLRTSSSRSSMSSSQYVSSSYEEENDGSQLSVSETSGWKMTQIDEGDGRTPLCTKKSDEEEVQKKTENLHLENKLFLLSTSFRRGEEVLEAQNFEGDSGMSNFRESRESTKECLATVSPGLPAAVLRDKVVQEKNTQALSNDLIEETANKLAEPSKSKVKALVSAFEVTRG